MRKSAVLARSKNRISLRRKKTAETLPQENPPRSRPAAGANFPATARKPGHGFRSRRAGDSFRHAPRGSGGLTQHWSRRSRTERICDSGSAAGSIWSYSRDSALKFTWSGNPARKHSQPGTRIDGTSEPGSDTPFKPQVGRDARCRPTEVLDHLARWWTLRSVGRRRRITSTGYGSVRLEPVAARTTQEDDPAKSTKRALGTRWHCRS